MLLEQLDILKKALKEDLPGWPAQKKLSPVSTEKYRAPQENSKKAAVNLLLFPDEANELKLIYIKRPAHPLDKHSGQISFPGGQIELGDISMAATALRETQEEIGIIKEDVEVIGELSPLYVFVSNFLVQPIVSFIPYQPKYLLQESEVNYVIEEKVSYLQLDSSQSKQDYNIRGIQFKDMPYFKLQGDVLWGATAMITSEFLSLLDLAQKKNQINWLG